MPKSNHTTLGTVLVVEDDQTIRGLVEMAVRRAGLAPVAVGSLRAARDWVLEHWAESNSPVEASDGAPAQPPPDDVTHVRVVLSDQGLPDGTGTELFEWLRQRSWGADVVALLYSGAVTHELYAKAKALAVRDVMQKPFSVLELVDTLRHVARGTAPPSASEAV